MTSKTPRGFTLIELLIVVLIIAILAAIAVPNFLEFQTRAKVARVMSDHRAIATGLEAYAVDNGRPPIGMPELTEVAGIFIPFRHAVWSQLTTPIAYYTAPPLDPFQVANMQYYPENQYYWYETYDTRGWYYPGMYIYDSINISFNLGYAWNIHSVGPSRNEIPPWVPMVIAAPLNGVSVEEALGRIYDPTNGTTSMGRVVRTNKGVFPDGSSASGV